MCWADGIWKKLMSQTTMAFSQGLHLALCPTVVNWLQWLYAFPSASLGFVPANSTASLHEFPESIVFLLQVSCSVPTGSLVTVLANIMRVLKGSWTLPKSGSTVLFLPWIGLGFRGRSMQIDSSGHELLLFFNINQIQVNLYYSFWFLFLGIFYCFLLPNCLSASNCTTPFPPIPPPLT